MGFQTQEEAERWYEEQEFMADYRREEQMLRYQQTVDALNRCAEAGAKPEDLIVLAKECGVEWKQ